MSASLTVDKREFNETMKRLAAHTSREMPLFLNSRLFHVAKKARTNTPAASREDIQASLGATLVSQKVNAKGKIRRRYKYAPTKLVYALVNARRRKAGLPSVTGEEMTAAARKLIAGRLRSIGTLKSGWNRALGILGASIRQFAPKEGPPVKGQSRAKPARAGKFPQSELEYLLRAGGRIHPEVVGALDRSFGQEHVEMLAQLDKKMNEVARKAGAK